MGSRARDRGERGGIRLGRAQHHGVGKKKPGGGAGKGRVGGGHGPTRGVPRALQKASRPPPDILGGGGAGFLNPEGYKEESEDEDDEDEDGDEDEDEDEDENEDEGEGEDGDGDGVEDEDEDGDEDEDEHAEEGEDEDEDERSRLPLHSLRSNKKGFFSHESLDFLSLSRIFLLDMLKCLSKGAP